MNGCIPDRVWHDECAIDVRTMTIMSLICHGKIYWVIEMKKLEVGLQRIMNSKRVAGFYWYSQPTAQLMTLWVVSLFSCDKSAAGRDTHIFQSLPLLNTCGNVNSFVCEAMHQGGVAVKTARSANRLLTQLEGVSLGPTASWHKAYYTNRIMGWSRGRALGSWLWEPGFESRP